MPALKYEVKKPRLVKALTLQGPGTLTHQSITPFFVIGSLY